MTPLASVKCQRLDKDGRRCRRDAVRSIQYHGDGECYNDLSLYPHLDVTWVRVLLCAVHANSIDPPLRGKP